MKYFLHLSYNGFGYSGWQYQPNSLTVQEVIEKALSAVLKQPIKVVGCGRTDAGVHASQYILHFTYDGALKDSFKFIVNQNLPAAISIYEVLQVSREKHARFDARKRTYDYFLHTQKDSFLNQVSTFYKGEKLDVHKMREAAKLLVSFKEFISVCKQPAVYKHTFCEVISSEIFWDDKQERIRFSITANRFLRGMVRYLVALLVKVGANQITLEQFKAVFETQTINFTLLPAAPNGLFLSKIEYKDLIFKENNNLCEVLKKDLTNH